METTSANKHWLDTTVRLAGCVEAGAPTKAGAAEAMAETIVAHLRTTIGTRIRAEAATIAHSAPLTTAISATDARPVMAKQ